MSVLLVTYDLNKEPDSSDYKGFMKVIKSYPWARLSESSYAIATSKSVEQIYSELSAYADKNDYVYIIRLHRPYTGFGPTRVNDWLDENLTEC